MATWGEFATAEPEMAAIGRRQLQPVPIMFLATVRRNGAPRVHPVCPILTAQHMYIAVAGGGRQHPSPKRFDLLRGGRHALHALPGEQDEEFCLSGHANRIADAALRALVSDAAGHTVHEADWIFELHISNAMTAYWENWTKPDTYAVRRFWHAP